MKGAKTHIIILFVLSTFTALGQFNINGDDDYSLKVYVGNYDSVSPHRYQGIDSVNVCVSKGTNHERVCYTTDKWGDTKTYTYMPGDTYTIILKKSGYDSAAIVIDMVKDSDTFMVSSYPKKMPVNFRFSPDSRLRYLYVGFYPLRRIKKHGVRMIAYKSIKN